MKSSKWYSDAAFYGTCLAALFVFAFMVWCLTVGLQDVEAVRNELSAPNPPITVSHFDTSNLESWCGQPSGLIRMVGAEFDGKDTFTDEDGNLWGWEDDSLEENGFYLLWIDNNNTSDLHDDVIVKVFQER